jgi:hypothetical protein
LLPPLFRPAVSSLGPEEPRNGFELQSNHKVFWLGTLADGPNMPQFFDTTLLRESLAEADLQMMLSPSDGNPRFVDAIKSKRFTAFMVET